jgi:MOSC domain-containing protein YiiM
MIRILTLLIGQPQTITDERGTWRSAIFRTPVAGPVALERRGLAGDQVADTAHHGSPDQAVCCHPLEHYAYWNAVYGLDTPDMMLGPGSVGENWTLIEATESDICVGDIFTVGSARVQVSGPRFPCMKQERKLQLAAFHKRTLETLRTGFYLRVLTPGTVQAGDVWLLEARPHADLTLHAINVCAHHTFDKVLAQRLLETPELSAGWKRILSAKLPGG